MNIRKLLIAIIAVLGLFSALGATSASAVTSQRTSDHSAARSDGVRGPHAAAPSVAANGNDGAWVSGVGYCSNINVNADCWSYEASGGTNCPAGHFCLYTTTDASAGSKVFSFYHCTNGGSDWALHGWNDWGSYHNNNYGGAHAYIKDYYHGVLRDIPVGGYSNYYFSPAWYVRAC